MIKMDMAGGLTVLYYWSWILALIILLYLFIRVSIWLLLTIIGKVFKCTINVTGFTVISVAEIYFSNSTMEVVISDVTLALVKSRSGFIGIAVESIKIKINRSSDKKDKPMKKPKHRQWNRLLRLQMAIVKVLLKIFQVVVNKVIVEGHFIKSSSLAYFDSVEVLGVSVKKSPPVNNITTSNDVGVCVEVFKVKYSSWICFDNKEIDLTHRLVSVDTSFNLNLFMKYVKPYNGKLIDTVQLTVPFFNIEVEAVSVNHILQRFAVEKSNNSVTSNDTSRTSLAVPMKKMEVIVSRSRIKYVSSIDDRYLEISTHDKASLILLADDHSSIESTAIIRGFIMKSSATDTNLQQLKQVNVTIKHASDKITNVNVSLSSSKTDITSELYYWISQVSLVIPKSPSSSKDIQPSSGGGSTFPCFILTVNISDCVMNMSLSGVTDPPMCQLVCTDSTIRINNINHPPDASSTSVCNTTERSVSVRILDFYIFVPSEGIKDNRSVLPITGIHHHGRILSIGMITTTLDLPSDNNGLSVTVKGQTWIIDWSERVLKMLPLVTKLRSLLQNRKSREKDSHSPVICVEVNGLNVFVTSHHNVSSTMSMMCRIDSLHMTKSDSETMLTLYKLGFDEIFSSNDTSTGIQCFSVDNLPSGGFAYMQQLRVTKIDKAINVCFSNISMDWSPGVHVSLMGIVKALQDHLKTIKESMNFTNSASNTESQVITKMSEKVSILLQRVPYTVNVDADECKLAISFSRMRNKEVCLSLVTCHASVSSQSLVLDVYEVKVLFDKSQICTVEGLQGQLPINNTEERLGVKDIEIKENCSIGLVMQRVEVYLPDNYKFFSTYEKLTNVRKFISSSTKLNSNSSSSTSAADTEPLLPLDIVIDVDELVFQVEDNQMEVKLRANYELLMDEAEERLLRESALEQELEIIKQNQGRLFSVKLSQNLKEDLTARNAVIYCQRAKELYCNEPLPTELITVNLSQLKLCLLQDKGLMGRSNLIQHIKTIDSISPLPDDYQFSTIWGTFVNGYTKHIEIHMRDYPWKLMEGKSIEVIGRLIMAEQEAHPNRECYTHSIDIGPFWSHTPPTITRKLPPLKFYHDFNIKSEGLEISWGPCLDPVFAQINYAFSLITKPSLDPSPPLPWWDKLRLLLHGRAVLQSSLSINLLMSPNPYNDIEFLVLQLIDLTATLHDNASILLEGCVEAYVYTASRYNKCRILQFPFVSADIQFKFITNGDSHGHHSITRCLHDQLPLLPNGQDHDSYRSFRSQNMSFNLTLAAKQQEEACPNMLLYASTLRWLQNSVDFIRSSISRPIRKGKVHNNVRPKKKRFTRHIKDISVSLQLPKTVIDYWSSVSKQQGLTVQLKECVVDIKQHLQLVPHTDGLIRRPQPQWSIKHCSSTVEELAVFACSSKQQDTTPDDTTATQNHTFEKRTFILLSKLTYLRIDPDDTVETSTNNTDFKHQLKTNDTKLVWSEFNRDIVYKLLNSFNLYKRLKRDLSSDALKSVFNKLQNSTPESPEQKAPKEESPDANIKHGRLKRHNSGCVMLDQLLADICNTLVTSEESRGPSDPKLKGITAANSGDVKHLDWFIELLCTQIALQGVERKGFIVCSSYIAQVFGREHNPRLRGGDMVSKKSWIAKVQDLQYFCSVKPSQSDYIPWLPLSTLEPPGVSSSNSDPESLTSLLLSQLGPDLAHPVGAQDILGSRPPGESVGGLVTSFPLLGVVYDEEDGVPLSTKGSSMIVQRIASRCHCQMCYVSYGDIIDEPITDNEIAATTSSPSSVSVDNDAVDTFTFRYPSSEVATTSFQYLLIMDVVNNLLLYKEPRKKESTEQHARLKFMLQLTSLSEEDIKKPILSKQNKLRQILSRLKTIENDFYIRYSRGNSDDGELRRLEQQLSFDKEELLQSSVELRAMIRAFKERQLRNSSLPVNNGDSNISPEPTRRIEIWMDDSKWSLMHNDGQLQVSDVHFSDFSYNRISYSDDSGEHRFELGSFRVKNCMPNTPQMYQEVLSPYDPASRRLRVDKNVSLRIYCRDQSPVAGISVTEHLELNVVPLSVKITGRFYNTLQEFFLPKAEAEAHELSSNNATAQHSNVLGVQPTYATPTDQPDGMGMSKIKSSNAPPSSPSVKEAKKMKKLNSGKIDDVEIMKTRASEVKTFIYVKLPQTSLCVTYRGEGIASVKEIVDKIVTIRTIEYHNLNMSWRSLLLEIKKDYKSTIISQILKSAIGFKETDEKAGLSSPKLGRSTSDILLGKVKEGKSKTKKVFSKTAEDTEYTPPLSERHTKLHKLN